MLNIIKKTGVTLCAASAGGVAGGLLCGIIHVAHDTTGSIDLFATTAIAGGVSGAITAASVFLAHVGNDHFKAAAVIVGTATSSSAGIVLKNELATIQGTIQPIGFAILTGAVVGKRIACVAQRYAL